MPTFNPHKAGVEVTPEVTRTVVNTTTPGEALVTKVSVDASLTETYTGADPGTGDVTIGLPVIPYVAGKVFTSVSVDYYGRVIGGTEGSLAGAYVFNSPGSRQAGGFLLDSGDVTDLTAFNITTNNLHVTTLVLSAPLEVSSGGTGVVIASAHQFFAGPLSGSAAPAFRILDLTDLPSIPFSQLSGLPTTVVGYGITDVYDKTTSDARYAAIAHTHSGYEPAVSAGTIAQYYRGDKTWANLTADAIQETSTRKYYTDALARAAISISGTNLQYNSITGVIGFTGTPTFAVVSLAAAPTLDVHATDKYYVDTSIATAVAGILAINSVSKVLSGNTANISIGSTGSVPGTGDVTLNLVATGVSVGTYTKVTIDLYGRVTATSALVLADIPNLSTLYQATSLELSALSGLATTGYVQRTGAHVYTTTSSIPSSDITGLAAIATSGSASDLVAGTVAAGRMPALSGDVTSASGTVATSIASATITGKILTGIPAFTATQIVSTDSILSAFAKTQGQFNALASTYLGIAATAAAATKLATPRTISATGDIAYTSAGFDGTSAVTGSATVSGIRGVAVPALTTGVLKYNGTSFVFDTTVYLTANQNITLSGDVTGSGTTAITTSLAASVVTGKLLTGLPAFTNTAILSTDSILAAFGKLQGQVNASESTMGNPGISGQVLASTTLGVRSWVSGQTIPGLLVTDSPVYANLNANGATGTMRELRFSTAGSYRWILRANSDAESTGDLGSNLELRSRHDDGSDLGVVVFIPRIANGTININRPVNLTSGGQLYLAGATATYASLNIPLASVNPAAPVLGDIWNTGSSIAVYNLNYRSVKPGTDVGGAGNGLVMLDAAPVSTAGWAIQQGASNDLAFFSFAGIYTRRAQLLNTGALVLTGSITATAATITGLTSTRIPFISTGGLVVDAATLTFDSANREILVGSSASAGSIRVSLDATSGNDKFLRIKTAGATRWLVGGDSTAESGTDAGTKFVLRAHTDAGVVIDDPISVLRVSAGTITIGGTSLRPTVFTGTLTATGFTKSGGTSSQFLKADGSVDASTYLTANQTITLSGDVTGSGATSITTAISSTTITGKLLTGYVVGSNAILLATDSVMLAFEKVQGQLNAREAVLGNPGTAGQVLASTTGGVRSWVSAQSIPGVRVTDTPTFFSTVLNGAAATTREIVFNTAGVNRWNIRGNSSAESGANAGTNFEIIARTDAGAAIDTPISIVRAGGGAISIGGSTLRPVAFTGTVTATSLIKSGGTSAQFLKADGSVDSSVYVTGGPYLALTGGNLSGTMQSVKDVVPSTSSNTNYSTAPVVVSRASTGVADFTNAAAIGFHNQGVNGAALFYDPSTSVFKYSRHSGGAIATIYDTSNLTISTLGGPYLALTGGSLSGTLTVEGLLFKRDITYPTLFGAIFGDGVTPGASNYSLSISRTNTSTYVNSSSKSVLSINGSDRVVAQPSGVQITGALTQDYDDKPRISASGAFTGVSMRANNLAGTGTRVVGADSAGNLTISSSNGNAGTGLLVIQATTTPSSIFAAGTWKGSASVGANVLGSGDKVDVLCAFQPDGTNTGTYSIVATFGGQTLYSASISSVSGQLLTFHLIANGVTMLTSTQIASSTVVTLQNISFDPTVLNTFEVIITPGNSSQRFVRYLASLNIS